MERGRTGRYEVTSVAGERVRAFVPRPLPPTPPLEPVGARQLVLEQALLALGRLDSVSTLLPDSHLFLYTYVRKEAVLSSQIEGTQSSLSDLLLFELKEAPGVPMDDVVEVSNYVAALNHGLRRLKGDFPVSNRLIREIHALLLTLLLSHAGVLKEPLLYLSLSFKQTRAEYYRLLDRVRTKGDWEAWIDFFLEGVRSTADSAVATARRLVALFDEDRERIQGGGRAAGSALRVHDILRERPVTSLKEVSRRTKLSFPAASSGMQLLAKLGVARELTGRRRNRLFAYDRYLAVLNEGTEPL